MIFKCLRCGRWSLGKGPVCRKCERKLRAIKNEVKDK